MNKMPAEVAQTPTEQAEVPQSPAPGESSHVGHSGAVKTKTPESNQSARLSLDLPLNRGRQYGEATTSNGEITTVADGGGHPRNDPHDRLSCDDHGTAHFYRRHNDRMPGNGYSRDRSTVHRQWSGDSSMRCDIHGGGQGREASQRRAEYRDRHGRRYQSDRPLQQAPDCPLPRDWSRVNGRGGVHQNGTGPGDDMENYFNANAHLLAYLELGENPPGQNGPYVENGPLGGENGHRRHITNQRQEREGGNGAINGDVNSYNTNAMFNSSSDDQGDFIEPDLCPGPHDLDHGGSSQLWSSEEELPQLTPNSSSSRNVQKQHKFCLNFNPENSMKKPGDGPKLIAPSNINSENNHNSYSVCDYKKKEEEVEVEVPRPASFGAANRLCTCSVVSYSIGRPDLTSSHSVSSGEADEGVGGMKVSPADPSPSESEGGGAQCGVTVTSDSSSYFSPEEVDFMDFDIEPTMTTPADNIRQFADMSNNILYPKDQNSDGHRDSKVHVDGPEQVENHSMITCEHCSKPDKSCLCQRLNVCKRLLEVSQKNQPMASSSAGRCPHNSYNRYEPPRLNDLEARNDNAVQCNCYNNEIGGNDSGAGSQEHLDELSSDDQGDETDHQPECPPRSCNCPVSRYYMGAPVCDQHDLYCHDTNNLDVEVFNAPSSDYEDELFNVSRQTSTSNFDQDENAYQDAVEDLASNGFHSACSGSDLESEKNNHLTNHSEGGDGGRRELGNSLSSVVQSHVLPPQIPLPIPSRGEESPRRRPPSIPPMGMNQGMEMEGGAAGGVENGHGPRPSWSTQSSDDISPMGALNWSDYDVPSDETDASRRPRLVNTVPLSNEHVGFAQYAGSSLDQDNLNSPTDNMDNDRLGFHVDHYEENTLSQSTLRSGRLEYVPEGDPPFPDPIPDIFILNLLREKECRVQDRACQSRSSVEKVMIWSEYDAYVTQVKQIGASACGATAVINVLKALDIYVDKCVVSRAVFTNLRAESAPLPEYLLSRSVAGCTADHLIQGIDTVTDGQVFGRFFCFYPDRDVDILSWLGDWIRRGAVPILTLNLQKSVPQGWEVPDAWHHQMAYGIGPKGVYLTNPLELVLEDVIRDQLTSESELLIQRHDIISRWSAETDLGMLLAQQDPRWRQMNVLGQVVNILREARRPRVMGFRPQLTTHIRIPAWYRPGISLFVRRDADVYQELRTAPDLPVRTVASPEDTTIQETAVTTRNRASPTSTPSQPCDARSEVVEDATPPSNVTPPHQPLPDMNVNIGAEGHSSDNSILSEQHSVPLNNVPAADDASHSASGDSVRRLSQENQVPEEASNQSEGPGEDEEEDEEDLVGDMNLMPHSVHPPHTTS